MVSGINWLLNRQYVGADKDQLNEVYFVDRMIEQFSCLRTDEYHIEGVMGMPLPPFVARFSTDLLNGNMLVVADEDGHVKLIDTSKTKSSSILREWSAHSNAIFDLAWIENESKMITASGDQTARLWDVKKCTPIGNFRGHTCSLKSVAVQPRSSCIFVTGARDGNIMIWDSRCSMKNGFYTPINTIHHAHDRPQNDTGNSSTKKKRGNKRSSFQNPLKQSVTAAVFLDDCRIISAGACDGAIKYWDIRKNYSSHKGEPAAFHVINISGKGPRKHGFTSLILNSSHSRLFSVCTNDIIYEFSTTNLHSQPVATYQGHRASSFYVKAALSPDDRYLLCGSGDNSAYIWRTDQSNMNPWMLNGHLGEVTSVAWSPVDGDKIVTCSDDNTFKVWRLFQDTSEPSMLSGDVKQCTTKDLETGQKLPVVVSLQENILSTDILKKEIKCQCNTLNKSSNSKARIRWNIGMVYNAKDTICKSMQQSNSSCSYTNVTPKSNNATPNFSLRDKLKSASNSPTTRQTIDCKSMSPKSSRNFMETWLKSPRTPLQPVSPACSEYGAANGFETRPGIKACTKNLTNTTSITSVGQLKVPTPRQKSDSPEIKSNHNLNNLPKHNLRGKRVIQTNNKVPGKSRKCTPSRKYGDIKLMLLSMKRKCKSPDEQRKSPAKDSLARDSHSKRLRTDKENIAGDIIAAEKKVEPTCSSKEVLKEKSMQNDVKDILDIAEDSSTLYYSD